MDIFLPDPATNLPGSTLPDASITPVNPDGTLNNHDIENKLAYMHVFPYAGGTTTTISYYVRRGGEIVGRSGERVYHVV